MSLPSCDPRQGFTGHVTTTIPVGTGLSSSAALEVAVALALGAQGPHPQLAETLRRAEHRASGVPCGIMDQLSSLAGVEGHALLIDCTALTVTPVALPGDVAVVVVDSGERRQLATSGYAARRAEVMEAEALIGPLPDRDKSGRCVDREPRPAKTRPPCRQRERTCPRDRQPRSRRTTSRLPARSCSPATPASATTTR